MTPDEAGGPHERFTAPFAIGVAVREEIGYGACAPVSWMVYAPEDEFWIATVSVPLMGPACAGLLISSTVAA
ncbi:MAG TPA: hypothetical protein VFX13_17255 [Gaiellales bacterium]|nr:hypothetical protein [Gaiellales bacterium]